MSWPVLAAVVDGRTVVVGSAGMTGEEGLFCEREDDLSGDRRSTPLVALRRPWAAMISSMRWYEARQAAAISGTGIRRRCNSSTCAMIVMRALRSLRRAGRHTGRGQQWEWRSCG